VLFCSLVDIPIARLADRLNPRNIVGTVGFHLGPIFAIAQSGRETQDGGAGLGVLPTGTCFWPGGWSALGRHAQRQNESVRYSLLPAAIATTLGVPLFLWAAVICADIERAT
jgi:hypothetical protein